mgnify:CR=1 FL=1
MDVKAILEKQIKELDKRIEKCEDEELRDSLVREMVSLTSEYSKLEANNVALGNQVVAMGAKESENRWKFRATLATGGIIIGSSVLGIVLDSVTGRIEKRKESKMQDNLTKLLK